LTHTIGNLAAINRILPAKSVDLSSATALPGGLTWLCISAGVPAAWLVVQANEGAASAGEAGPSMQFIDFEYSSYSHRGFDWGNHFNEYAGFDCDYSRYPGQAQAELFVRSYLAEASGSEPVSPICRLDRALWREWDGGTAMGKMAKVGTPVAVREQRDV
jgi:Choline/ethanolamine kinase